MVEAGKKQDAMAAWVDGGAGGERLVGRYRLEVYQYRPARGGSRPAGRRGREASRLCALAVPCGTGVGRARRRSALTDTALQRATANLPSEPAFPWTPRFATAIEAMRLHGRWALSKALSRLWRYERRVSQ